MTNAEFLNDLERRAMAGKRKPHLAYVVAWTLAEQLRLSGMYGGTIYSESYHEGEFGFILATNLLLVINRVRYELVEAVVEKLTH